MGEAKRRKKLDPNYGKPNANTLLIAARQTISRYAREIREEGKTPVICPNKERSVIRVFKIDPCKLPSESISVLAIKRLSLGDTDLLGILEHLEHVVTIIVDFD